MNRLLFVCSLLAVLVTLSSCETGGSALDRPAVQQGDEGSGTYHPPTPPVYGGRGYAR